MSQYAFGSGTLFGVRTDITYPTPVQFGAISDISVEIDFTLKQLYGQSQFPLAVARSNAKVTGKAKFAKINGATFNNLFFGQTLAAGQKVTSLNEAGTVPASTPYTVTVANASAFVDDLGVLYQTTGLPLARVQTVSAAGQYSVAAGVYSFYSGDASAGVQLSYTYTIAGSGTKMTVANQLAGSAPVFKAVLYETFQGKTLQLELLQCVSTKLSFPTKQEDYVTSELDFSAFADGFGNVMNLSFAE
ncbi:MAG TPA: hypothetical protein VMF53_11930 [Alphaproteobacteria bacterium]|nr:hypothetical protein [Alphaproteobacteria bacterium]